MEKNKCIINGIVRPYDIFESIGVYTPSEIINRFRSIKNLQLEYVGRGKRYSCGNIIENAICEHHFFIIKK